MHGIRICDLPNGETDTLLNQFSIERDKKYIIPVLLEALNTNHRLRLLPHPGAACLDEEFGKFNGRTLKAGILRCLCPIFC